MEGSNPNLKPLNKSRKFKPRTIRNKDLLRFYDNKAKEELYNNKIPLEQRINIKRKINVNKFINKRRTARQKLLKNRRTIRNVAAEEPVEAAEEPIAAAEEPVVAAEEPVEAAEEPVVAAEEPVVAAEEPVSYDSDEYYNNNNFNYTNNNAQELVEAVKEHEPYIANQELVTANEYFNNTNAAIQQNTEWNYYTILFNIVDNARELLANFIPINEDDIIYQTEYYRFDFVNDQLYIWFKTIDDKHFIYDIVYQTANIVNSIPNFHFFNPNIQSDFYLDPPEVIDVLNEINNRITVPDIFMILCHGSTNHEHNYYFETVSAFRYHAFFTSHGRITTQAYFDTDSITYITPNRIDTPRTLQKYGNPCEYIDGILLPNNMYKTYLPPLSFGADYNNPGIITGIYHMKYNNGRYIIHEQFADNKWLIDKTRELKTLTYSVMEEKIINYINEKGININYSNSTILFQCCRAYNTAYVQNNSKYDLDVTTTINAYQKLIRNGIAVDENELQRLKEIEYSQRDTHIPIIPPVYISNPQSAQALNATNVNGILCIPHDVDLVYNHAAWKEALANMNYKGSGINVLNYLSIGMFADTNLARAYAVSLPINGSSLHTIQNFIYEHYKSSIDKSIVTIVWSNDFVDYMNSHNGLKVERGKRCNVSIIKCYANEIDMINDVGRTILIAVTKDGWYCIDPLDNKYLDADYLISRYAIGVMGVNTDIPNNARFFENALLIKEKPINIVHGGVRDKKLDKFIITYHAIFKSMVIYTDLIINGMVKISNSFLKRHMGKKVNHVSKKVSPVGKNVTRKVNNSPTSVMQLDSISI